MRNRAATVIVKDEKVALLRKDKANMFAGSGIEHSETAEHAAIRAAFKELSVHVKHKTYSQPFHSMVHNFIFQLK
jgi:8-oxo-dGTP diphosphatase